MAAQNNAEKIEYKLNKFSHVYQKYPFLNHEWYECAVDRADVKFIFEQLSKVPDEMKQLILDNAFKLKERRERNLYILQYTEKLVSLLPEKLRRSMATDDEGVRVIAQDCADRCRRMALHHNVNGRVKPSTALPINEDFSYATKRLEPLTEICGSNSAETFRILTEYAASFRIEAIKVTEKGATELGAIKRMCDKNWWMRRLRKIFNQAYEQTAIELNLVHKYKQIYASDLTVKKRQQQRAYNEQMLSSMSVINDAGQRFSLKELSDLNVSNPAVRKAELMVRMRGFEELSKEHGHQGMFITITCPSKYHAVYSKSGQPNPKYQHLTPYQANQYLCGLW